MRAYFGSEPTDTDVSRVKLLKFVSDLREALWALVQSRVSKTCSFEEDMAYYAECLGRCIKYEADPSFKNYIQLTGNNI